MYLNKINAKANHGNLFSQQEQPLCPTGHVLRLYIGAYNDDLVPNVALLFIQYL